MIMICLFRNIIVISIIIAIEIWFPWRREPYRYTDRLSFREGKSIEVEIRFPLGEGTLSERQIAFPRSREGYRGKPPLIGGFGGWIKEWLDPNRSQNRRCRVKAMEREQKIPLEGGRGVRLERSITLWEIEFPFGKGTLSDRYSSL